MMPISVTSNLMFSLLISIFLIATFAPVLTFVAPNTSPAAPSPIFVIPLYAYIIKKKKKKKKGGGSERIKIAE
jgi:hypothetical protein